MNKRILYFGGMLAIAFQIQPAHAGKSVTSPYVSEGEWEIEAKSQLDLDNDASNEGFEQSFEIGYGITDFLGLEAGIEFEDTPGEDLYTKQLEVEGKIQFTEENAFIVDSGLKLAYKYNLSGAADSVEAKLLLGKKFEKWEHVANLEIGREVGDDSDDHEEYGIAWKTKYKYNYYFDPGFEYYGDFGDTTEDYDGQSHRLGPVAYGHIVDGFEYEAGLLAGISDGAPDATLKLNLEYEF